MAVAMREDDLDDEVPEDDDPNCPMILFTAMEKQRWRRKWRSALIVTVFLRTFPYPVITRSIRLKGSPIILNSKVSTGYAQSGKYGHSKMACPKLAPKTGVEVPPTSPPEEPVPQRPLYGEWMVVKPRGRNVTRQQHFVTNQATNQ
ncbi:unnamed protein product [Linum tenue]|uniref:Uncharacterized protein n=1 Tax=Linum tenue TaxID=586396 RepID=A0AAV0QLP8_9ROSI|nr:unnamed protein product [Linum tenue]